MSSFAEALFHARCVGHPCQQEMVDGVSGGLPVEVGTMCRVAGGRFTILSHSDGAYECIDWLCVETKKMLLGCFREGVYIHVYEHICLAMYTNTHVYIDA